jgi:cell wall-associated NlpC family hydrolase
MFASFHHNKASQAARRITIFVLVLCLPMVGCAQSKQPTQDASTMELRTLDLSNQAAAQGEKESAKPSIAAGAMASISALVEKRSELVLSALSLLGVNYKFGGNSPDTGLDCSGLVRLVFNQTMGLVLPRRSEEMSKAAAAVETKELQPGDLVFFNTLKRAFSHVGIYIGNGQFVHAPSSGGLVRVERMDSSYWQTRFNGARRVNTGVQQERQ